MPQSLSNWIAALLISHFANKPLFTCQLRTPNVDFFSVDSKQPDSAGGMAASVIVILLLIATLIALLVYYLQTGPKAVVAPSSSPPSSDRAGFSNATYESEPTVSSSDGQGFHNTHNHPCKIMWLSLIPVYSRVYSSRTVWWFKPWKIIQWLLASIISRWVYHVSIRAVPSLIVILIVLKPVLEVLKCVTHSLTAREKQ